MADGFVDCEDDDDDEDDEHAAAVDTPTMHTVAIRTIRGKCIHRSDTRASSCGNSADCLQDPATLVVRVRHATTQVRLSTLFLSREVKPMIRVRTAVGTIAVLALVCASPATASASPGEVDTSFGPLGNGTVVSGVTPVDGVVKVLHQPDGKIVTIADTLGTSVVSPMLVTRRLANGALDSSFAHGGVFSRELTGAPSSAVLQPDGKIVVVGFDDGIGRFFILRLLANGAVDPAFGSTAPQWFGSTTAARALTVALGPAGTIVVGGISGGNVALARYSSSGNLDNSFSGDGLLIHDFGDVSEADAVGVLPDGRIIVAGTETLSNAPTRNLLARFTATGSLDSTFGTGGRALTTSSPLQSMQTMILQGTKPVVAGVIGLVSAGLSRYNADGTIDTTFGTAGTTRTHIGAFTRIASLETDASGHLLAAGEVAYSNSRNVVTTFTSVSRYSANGTPDAGFGCAGTAITEVLGDGAGSTYNASVATSAAAAGDDIVVGGIASRFDPLESTSDDLLVRYHGSGAPTSGYSLLRGDGGTSAFGGAAPCGSTSGLPLNKPIVGIATDPAAPGNWTVASDGGVFTFGAAGFFGSTGAIHLNQPIVGMAAAPNGKGYWLVARDGGVFAFGSARFFGSTGAIHLNQPIVGMAAVRDGKGYWLVARDGGVFAFGSAKFAGSTGMLRLNKPIVGMAADPDGTGYWLVASDGGIFAFRAKFSGSTGNITLNQPMVGIAADPDGTGYWMAARDGGVFAFSAKYAGSTGSTPFPVGAVRSTIGIAATP